MAFGLTALITVSVLVASLMTVRFVRWRTLLDHAKAPQSLFPLPDPSSSSAEDRSDTEELSTGRAAAEGAAAVAAGSAAQWFWLRSRVDPDAIDAVSAASAHLADGTASVGDTFNDFAAWAATNPDILPGTGAFTRLIGYVGEQQAADALVQQGYLVTQPEVLPNNPGWDMLVNGDVANVKTYADASNIADYVNAHPDMNYVVNSDAANLHLLNDADNVIIGEYTRAGAEDTLQSSLDAVNDLAGGEFVMAAMDTGIPITLVAFVAYRQVKAVREGKRIQDALVDGGLEVIVRGTGVVAGGAAGAQAGALVDAVFMGGSFGAFALIGAVAGGAAGSVAGAKAVRWWKQRPVNAARDDLNMWLAIYGEEFTSPSAQLQIQDMLATPVKRSKHALAAMEEAHEQDRRTLRYWLWPSPEQALRAATIPIGHTYLANQTEEFRVASENWQEISTSPLRLGAAMANAPQAAACLNVDPSPLDAIGEARQRLDHAIERAGR